MKLSPQIQSLIKDGRFDAADVDRLASLAKQGKVKAADVGVLGARYGDALDAARALACRRLQRA